MNRQGPRDYGIVSSGIAVKLCLAVLALVALVLLESMAQPKDFWKEKPAQEWTREEAMAVLTDSSWAKEVVVSYFSGRFVEEVKREERLYVGGRGKGTIRTATTRVHRQPELAEARYMVWWSSAAIVQQARQRLRQVAPRAVTEFHAPPPVLSLEEYVLTVRVVRPPAQPTNHLFQGLGEGELIEGAELRTNRKLTFKPTRVVRDGLGAGTSLSFFFPLLIGV